MSKIIRLIFLVVFACFLPPTLDSGQAAERDILVRTEQTLAGLDSFQTDFEQSFFSMTVSEPLREKGRLFYQKPGRMRWEYRGGSSQIVVLNDGVMETFDPGENQLIRQRIPEEQTNGAIFGLLSGRARLADAYKVENSPFPGAEGPVHQLKLTPVEEGETAYILVEIDARTFFLRRAILFDWAGNKNEFAFSRLKTNPRLGPDVFTIKVPDGCEIIDDVDSRQR
ncbi:MAG: outer membrane lipoprotein carrier protein LolA [Candidatus Aminicenantes bacterium]|nr:outer membrane lipoprotein carrier protein LolA [Candidatus Aminicenantes bacterium]